MSLFSWLFPSRKEAARTSLPESSGLSRMEPTRPIRRGTRELAESNAQPANRKQERMARRELLYAVVRESMVHAGVLSSSYKFKVLSLDGRGRQFLVMVDLSRDTTVQTPQLGEIEAMIAQQAKLRHDILVSAVYWRMSEHVAVGEPAAQPISVTKSHDEPIGQDEVAAFRQAIAAGVRNPAATAAAAAGVGHGASAMGFDGSNVHGPQSYTLLTGFEDTEIADGDPRGGSALSGTQYGELN